MNFSLMIYCPEWSPEALEILRIRGGRYDPDNIFTKNEALNVACYANRLDYAEFLLRRFGAQCLRPTDFNSPLLHLLMQVGEVEACRLLLNWGARVMEKNFQGQTALEVGLLEFEGYVGNREMREKVAQCLMMILRDTPSLKSSCVEAFHRLQQFSRCVDTGRGEAESSLVLFGCSCPHSLQGLARMAIRSCFPPGICKAEVISGLPLPEVIREYLKWLIHV